MACSRERSRRTQTSSISKLCPATTRTTRSRIAAKRAALYDENKGRSAQWIRCKERHARRNRLTHERRSDGSERRRTLAQIEGRRIEGNQRYLDRNDGFGRDEHQLRNRCLSRRGSASGQRQAEATRVGRTIRRQLVACMNVRGKRHHPKAQRQTQQHNAGALPRWRSTQT